MRYYFGELNIMEEFIKQAISELGPQVRTVIGFIVILSMLLPMITKLWSMFKGWRHKTHDFNM